MLYRLICILLPNRLKKQLLLQLKYFVTQNSVEHWAQNMLVPLDQKIARLEASITGLQRSVERLQAEIEKTESRFFGAIGECEAGHAARLEELASTVREEWSAIDLRFSQCVERRKVMEGEVEMLAAMLSSQESRVDGLSSSIADGLRVQEQEVGRCVRAHQGVVEQVESLGKDLDVLKQQLVSEYGWLTDSRVLRFVRDFEHMLHMYQGMARVFSEEEYEWLEQRHHRKFSALDHEHQAKVRAALEGGTTYLDIGCGEGDLLRQILSWNTGASVTGLDQSSRFVDRALALGLDVRTGDALQEVKQMRDGSFDVIVASHFVEHVGILYLRYLLGEIFRLLQPGGKLVLETPNTQSLYVMHRYYYQDPSHLAPRHPQMLVYLLELAGFERVSLDYVGFPPWEACLESAPPEDGVQAQSSGNFADVANKNFERVNRLAFASGNNALLIAYKPVE